MASSSTLRLPRNCSLDDPQAGRRRRRRRRLLVAGRAGVAAVPAASAGAAASPSAVGLVVAPRARRTRASRRAQNAAPREREPAARGHRDARSFLLDDHAVGHAQPARHPRRELVVVGDDRIVIPSSRLSSKNSSCISRRSCVSRLPVGSSASSSARPQHQRARERDPLLLAARQLAGPVREAVAPAPRRRSIVAARSARRRARQPLDEPRHHRVLERGELGQQVVELEHEADLAGCGTRPAGSAFIAVTLDAVERDRAPRSAVSSVPSTCSSVDLPTPDAPTTAAISPGCRSKFRPRRTSMFAAAVREDLGQIPDAHRGARGAPRRPRANLPSEPSSWGAPK